MLISRRSMLASVIGGLTATPALAQSVIRRIPSPGEDPDFFGMGAGGPYTPFSSPIVVPFQNAKTIVYAPSNAPKARLVVFSHGALLDPSIYRLLLNHLASHGFCVAAPVHDDSVFERGLLTRRTETQTQAIWEIDRVLNDTVAWELRIQACQRTVEHPGALSRAIGIEVDASRPIIIGHEFGALVAQLIMGAEAQTSDGVMKGFADGRFVAGCMLSAQGPGVLGLTENSWAKCVRPMMVIQPGSESDFSRQKPQDKIAPFSLSPAGYKHLAWFSRGQRGLYAGPRAGISESEAETFEDLKSVVTAFVKSYGDYDTGTFQKLASDWTEKATLGRVKTYYR